MPGLDVVALLSRTSDRTPGGGRGARALLDALGTGPARHGEAIGEPEPPRTSGFAEDLEAARAGLSRLGGALEASLEAGHRPVLLASDCTICVASLPVVARRIPDARLLWLDAHADFNVPETTPSGFLGGMCLAAACGRWDSGFAGSFPPERVVLSGMRDVDPGEQVELEAAGLTVIAPGAVLAALADAPVYVHLDLDVLDPSVIPAQFAVPGGPAPEELRELLAAVAARGPIAGLEVTAFEAPEDAETRARLTRLVTGILEPLLA